MQKYLLLALLCCNICCSPAKPINNKTKISIDTLFVASWNLKNFGETKFEDPVRMGIIVDIITRYDIIALQEVQDADLSMPGDLIGRINQEGYNYQVVASERVGRGNRKEQYLFLYNDDKVDTLPGTSGFGIEPLDEFAREPFYCMFKAGEFDFYLMTIHTDPDDVAIELPALRNAYLDLQANTPTEDDIILLGDFNAQPPAAEIGSYIDLDAFIAIPNIFFSIWTETNTRGGRCYDNIIFQSNYTSEYLESGVFRFETDYNLTNDEAFSVSDHLPVYACFLIGEDDD